MILTLALTVTAIVTPAPPAKGQSAETPQVQASANPVASADELAKAGNALAQLRRWDQAIAAYTLALAQNPKDGNVLASRALCYGWINRVDEALSDLSRAEALMPDSAIMHRVRAIIADRRSDQDTELAELSRSLELEPGNPFALLFRAQIFQRRQLYPAALADADAYIRAQPDEPEAYQLKAGILGAQRRWPEALAVARLLRVRFSEEPRALASAAQIYSDSGDRADALATIDQALRMDEGLYSFWTMKSGMRRWDDFTGRQGDLETALKLAPGDLGVTVKLGLLAFDRGDWADARIRFTQTLERNPKDFGVLAYRAMTLLQLGQPADALKDYNAALAAISGSDDFDLVCNVFAHEGLATDWGLASCDKAVALKPNDPAYLSNRGLVRLRLKNVAGAYRDFDQAVSRNPNQANAYYGRAIVRHRTGDAAGAARDRTTALEIDPTVEDDFCAHGLSELRPQPETPKPEGSVAISAA